MYSTAEKREYSRLWNQWLKCVCARACVSALVMHVCVPDSLVMLSYTVIPVMQWFVVGIILVLYMI